MILHLRLPVIFLIFQFGSLQFSLNTDSSSGSLVLYTSVSHPLLTHWMDIFFIYFHSFFKIFFISPVKFPTCSHITCTFSFEPCWVASSFHWATTVCLVKASEGFLSLWHVTPVPQWTPRQVGADLPLSCGPLGFCPPCNSPVALEVWHPPAAIQAGLSASHHSIWREAALGLLS